MSVSAMYLLIFVLGQFYLLFCIVVSRYYMQMRPAKYDDPVLVMYVFSNTEPEYTNNLLFFLREAVRPGDGCEYVFIIQQGDDIPEFTLPKLPRNARYLFHPNVGFDWGTFGWLLEEKLVDITAYNYFIFINSSVRGPFLPSYMNPSARWVDIFIDKLNDKVKLVGPTINCEPSHDFEGNQRPNPHVQSYAMATDRVGLKVMMDDGRVFKSYENFQDTVFYSEVGSTLSILNAGYTIDSFMMRYAGVDWTDPNQWNCNQYSNPTVLFHYDGMPLHPLEVVFVKYKNKLSFNRWSNMHTVAKYDDWIQQSKKMKRQQIQSNDWVDDPLSIKAALILDVKKRGLECFDADFYKTINYDLPDWPDDLYFTHYAEAGQFEGRKYKFKCEANYTGVIEMFF